MTYHVSLVMPDGTRKGADVEAANDSDLLRAVLLQIPAGAVIDAIELPEAA